MLFNAFYLVASGSVFHLRKKKGRNSQVSGEVRKARGRATGTHVGDISASTLKHSSVSVQEMSWLHEVLCKAIFFK